MPRAYVYEVSMFVLRLCGFSLGCPVCSQSAKICMLKKMGAGVDLSMKGEMTMCPDWTQDS